MKITNQLVDELMLLKSTAAWFFTDGKESTLR